MSHQGDRPAGRTGPSGQEDDWWGQLYDDSTDDTGPAAGADTLDDRFASASGTLETAPPPPEQSSTERPRPERPRYTPPRAPWEPPESRRTPATFGPRRRPHAPSEASGSRAPVVGVPPQRPAEQPPRPTVGYVGDGPPTYDPEPVALPAAEPDALDELVADTVLDGARYGTSTLRMASVRGDSARYRGEPRRDSLLTARFGSGDAALILVAMATGARTAPDAHRAAADACQWIGRAVGRSHPRLVEDIRAARRGDLKSGLHRLADRSLGKLRAAAAERGLAPEEYTAASLRCLLIPADPQCRTRVFFGVGGGGLFRLRDGVWQDIEPQATESTGAPVVGFGSAPTDPAAGSPQAGSPQAGSSQAGSPDAETPDAETPEGDRFTMDLGIATPSSPCDPAPEPSPREPFRFRASVARPGDTLLLCTGGLAEPLRGRPELAGILRERWSAPEPPGLAAFLADTQLRVKGYADDRTACAVWEAAPRVG
ncbi:protein phosphatase 2C domain-containing protein [Streptomyces sp. O3]